MQVNPSPHSTCSPSWPRCRARPARSGPSPTRVARYLRDLALEVEEDDAGAEVGSTIGNLLCRLEPHGADGGGVPLFLCAHLDTVPPEGADRAGGRGRRRPQRGRHDPRRGQQGRGRRHARGRRGASSPRAGRTRASSCCSRPRRRSGCSAPAPSTTRACAPRSATSTTRRRRSARSSSARRTRSSLLVRFHGRAAHAGMYPEEGRSAIAAAARAIADFRLGRLDEETTANVGAIAGRNRAEHRPGVVHVHGGGALARRAQARGRRPGDARRDRVRRQRRGVRGGDARSRRATAATASAATTRPSRWRPRRSRGRATSRPTRCRAAAPTRTSSTSAGSRASTSRTGWRRSTPPTSTSRSPTSTGWSRSRSRSSTLRACRLRATRRGVIASSA